MTIYYLIVARFVTFSCCIIVQNSNGNVISRVYHIIAPFYICALVIHNAKLYIPKTTLASVVCGAQCLGTVLEASLALVQLYVETGILLLYLYN